MSLIEETQMYEKKVNFQPFSISPKTKIGNLNKMEQVLVKLEPFKNENLKEEDEICFFEKDEILLENQRANLDVNIFFLLSFYFLVFTSYFPHNCLLYSTEYYI